MYYRIIIESIRSVKKEKKNGKHKLKKIRVKIRFLCDQVGELKSKGLNVRTVFDQCWNRIPETMIQKLNAEELLVYIQRHILPIEITLMNANKNAEDYRSKTA
nr:Uncharacterized protein A9P81_0648 [Leptospira interrogans serovar Copenhageni/Icterohaemorrhagiae]